MGPLVGLQLLGPKVGVEDMGKIVVGPEEG
jgi:hypothetical protein